ncbi:Protein CBR-NHR-171 [Caenorhabditis briggsae]|uniref:Protein CBR-NHR-171 n=1 Tax=Caenorhabditis briggsae TaxID=6238 RepID=A8WNV8_CAEBR|nr:Protein CBR-NHR-171 [Caenorhabditis briggsae]CAP22164.2 Protein CBR-NHR-171 [Caenorhabditis briggsae]
MATPSPSTSNDSSDFEKICTICGRPAFVRYYGAVACGPCKMFFRRMVIEKLTYKCKKIKICYITEPKPLKCKSCRFKRCVEVGMKLPPTNCTVLELKNREDDELVRLFGFLKIRDDQRMETYMNFYTTQNPSLEDILDGVKPVKMDVEKLLDNEIDDNSCGMVIHGYFKCDKPLSKFRLQEQLESRDKKLIFQFNTFKSNILCGAVRACKEHREKMVTPSGHDIFPDILVTKFNASAELLNRICCQVVARLMELKVTDEEFVLLNIIFFCNSADAHSDKAKSILAARQRFYVSALFKYCQLTYQNNAPSRLNELLSVYHIVQKNASEMQYIGIMIHGFIPNFPIRKLVSDTYMLKWFDK